MVSAAIGTGSFGRWGCLGAAVVALTTACEATPSPSDSPPPEADPANPGDPTAEGEGEGEGPAEAQALPGPPDDFDVARPAPPAPPDLGAPDCPDGWTPEAEAAPELGPGPCVPPVEVVCEGAHGQFASDAACVRVGTQCPPEGGFPPEEVLRGFVVGDAAAGPILYVSREAAPGGDGSRDRPLQQLATALDRAERDGGAIVVLASGTYRGPTLELRRASLVGACASGVILSPRGTRGAMVRVAAEGPVTVANLTLTGPERGIVTAGGSAQTHVRSVRVEEVLSVAVGFGLGSPGGTVDTLVVRGVDSDGDLGLGLAAFEGAAVTGRRVQVVSVVGAALAAMDLDGRGPGQLELEDVRVSGREGEAGGEGRIGALCDGSSELTLRQVVISGPWRNGLRAIHAQGQGMPTVHVDVGRFGPLTPGGDFGEGLILVGASGTLRRVGVHRVRGAGIVLHAAEGERLEVEDARIHDVFTAGEVFGSGVSAEGGHMDIRRLAIRRVDGLGAQLFGEGTFVHGEDWDIEALEGFQAFRGAPAIGGDGIRLHHGGSASLTRLRIDGVGSEGIVIAGRPESSVSHLDLADAEVLHAAPAEGSVMAAGISVYDGGSLALQRVRVADNEGVGFVCLDQKHAAPARVVAEDLLIARSWASRRVEVGAGLLVESGCSFEGKRVALVENDLAGLWTDAGGWSAPVTVTLEDLLIEDSQSTPDDHRLGYGAIFSQGSNVQVSRALVTGNRLAGVAAAGWGRSPETRVLLDTVVVRDTLPSVCGQLPADDPMACISDGQARGVGAGIVGQAGARLTVRDFLVTGSAFAGLAVGRGATVRASHGRVTRNGIGLVIWDEEYDLDLLSDEVFNFDNDVEVAVEELTVPVPAAALSGLGLD